MRYKGKLLLEFTKEGVWFPYKGDEVLRSWPWKKIDGNNKYRCSSRLGSYLNFANYKASLDERGVVNGKITGFSLSHIILNWAGIHLRSGFNVVLFDVNVNSRNSDFWDRIPDFQKKQLTKDVVVLNCKDMREVKHLCDSINMDFAIALGFDHGRLKCWNED